MKRAVNVYKPQGATPLEVIEHMRETHREYRDEKMTYAGRLDPMAEGVLLIAIGDAVHEKDTLLKLDKIYEVDILFGFETDTHDLLGLAVAHNAVHWTKEDLAREVGAMRGVFEYPFPIYASKPVQGKPLFQWAREGRLEEIEIPKRSMRVNKVELLEQGEMQSDEVKDGLVATIAKVKGDFRQDAIITRWQQVLANEGYTATYATARIRIHCTSGTYVRTLVYELGKRLGVGATVMRLVRTAVGNYELKDSIQL